MALPAGPRAAGAARSAVRARLRDLALDELVDPVALLTSELVTNALVHAVSTPSLSITATGSGGVRVVVTDSSPVAPVRKRSSPGATTGRGVQLLDSLADDWGWTPLPEGKAVWFLVSDTADRWAGSAEPWGEAAGA